jgi:hypothetical protein
VRAIADAAAQALPGVVNRYLVADQTTPATVQIINPPGDPTRSRPNQRVVFVGLLGLGAVAGTGLALLAHAWGADAARAASESVTANGKV